MKKHLLLTAALIAATFSMNSFASTRVSHTSIETELSATKAEAYATGFELLSELNEASSVELSQKLPSAVHGASAFSYELEDGSVKVMELSRTPGVIEYKAVVDVEYSFDDRNS